MTDKTKILERLKLAAPRLAHSLEPERAMADLAADSIDLVDLFVVIDSDFEVRVKEDEFAKFKTVDDLLQFVAERTEK